MTFTIRALTAADTDAAHPLRQQALRQAPLAFASSPGDSHETPDAWRALLGRAEVYGGFDGRALRGMAGLRFNQAAKTRHKAHLWGVYVAPEARGRGLGRMLVAHVIAQARGRATQVDCGVAAANAPALALYESLGFVRYGTEPAALRVDGQDIDEHLMVLRL